MKIKLITKNKSQICEEILRSLPGWFGIEDAIQEYVREVNNLPFYAVEQNNQIIGFAAIKQHFKESAEIYVMAIKKEFHGQGVGKKLIAHIRAELKESGTEFLSVKTLSPARENKPYAQTRKFYESVGFKPLEELKELWGKENPCLMMVMGV